MFFVAKVLLLLSFTFTFDGDIEEFAYFQYMEVTNAASGVDR